MSGPRRLAVFLSVVWVGFTVMVSSAYDESLGSTLFMSAPVWLGWGVWWVRQGFTGDRASAPTPLPPTPPRPAGGWRRVFLIGGGLLLMLAAIGATPGATAIDPRDTVGQLGAGIGILLLAVAGLFMFLRGVRRVNRRVSSDVVKRVFLVAGGIVILLANNSGGAAETVLGFYPPDSAQRVGFDIVKLAIAGLGLVCIYRGARPQKTLIADQV